MAPKYSIEHSYDIIMVEKYSKYISDLVINLLIVENAEDVVVKINPSLNGYSMPPKYFLGGSSSKTRLDITFKGENILELSKLSIID